MKAFENNNFLPIEQYILKFLDKMFLLQIRQEEKYRKPF